MEFPLTGNTYGSVVLVFSQFYTIQFVLILKDGEFIINFYIFIKS